MRIGLEIIHANILTKNLTILYQWANELLEEILREHNKYSGYAVLLLIAFY